MKNKQKQMCDLSQKRWSEEYERKKERLHVPEIDENVGTAREVQQQKNAWNQDISSTFVCCQSS